MNEFGTSSEALVTDGQLADAQLTDVERRLSAALGRLADVAISARHADTGAVVERGGPVGLVWHHETPAWRTALATAAVTLLVVGGAAVALSRPSVLVAGSGSGPAGGTQAANVLAVIEAPGLRPSDPAPTTAGAATQWLSTGLRQRQAYATDPATNAVYVVSWAVRTERVWYADYAGLPDVPMGDVVARRRVVSPDRVAYAVLKGLTEVREVTLPAVAEPALLSWLPAALRSPFGATPEPPAFAMVPEDRSATVWYGTRTWLTVHSFDTSVAGLPDGVFAGAPSAADPVRVVRPDSRVVVTVHAPADRLDAVASNVALMPRSDADVAADDDTLAVQQVDRLVRGSSLRGRFVLLQGSARSGDQCAELHVSGLGASAVCNDEGTPTHVCIGGDDGRVVWAAALVRPSDVAGTVITIGGSPRRALVEYGADAGLSWALVSYVGPSTGGGAVAASVGGRECTGAG